MYSNIERSDDEKSIKLNDISQRFFNSPRHLKGGAIVDITFCWAQEWYAKMYKKLGWMALIKSQGYRKYRMYLNTIDHLIASIELKKTNTTNPDRVNDLNIILINTRKLRDFANKLFNDTTSSNESSTEDGIPTKVTMRWLSKWHVKMYQKLGWMALKRSEGKRYKVKCYLRSINDLIASGNKKINELRDSDNIIDAKIILSNSLKLKEFAQKLLL